jgi:hypothetical protein
MNRLFFGVLSFGLLAGCGEDDEIPGVTAIYGAPETTTLTPYPSNRYTVPDATTKTGLRVHIEATGDLVAAPGLEETLAELGQMDGFSPTGGVIATFDGPIDITGIALPEDVDPKDYPPLHDAAFYTGADSPFLLVDVDPASEHQGEAIGIVPRWWEQAKDNYYVADEYTLLAQPAVPLRPGTRYLFVVTDALRARSGGEVERSPLSEELLGPRAGAAPSDPYTEEVAAGLAVLESSVGVAKDRVKLATTFTTASVLDVMRAAAEAARDQPPVLSEAWEIETPEEPDGRARFRATFEAPEYRHELPDGRWELDAGGKPVVLDTVDLEVFLAVSDAQSSEKRPVVIFQHGLGGDKDGCWGTAERLGALNAAVFAIDSPHHGSRGEPGGDDLTPVVRFFGVDLDEQTFVIGRARDNFRQMAADQLALVELIGSLEDLDILPPGAPDGVPDLDTSRIFYVGHSFGSVQGATIFALAPEITHAVWNVGGAGLMMLLRDSQLFSLLVDGLRPPGYSDGAVARFMAVTQAIVDPGDPLNFARFAQLEPTPGVDGWVPRDVLLQEVIADSIVPNSVSEALARAAGLPLLDVIHPVSGLPEQAGPVSGNLASGATGGMSQFDRMEGDKTANHGELLFSTEGRAQYVAFFTSALADAHATIPPAYP